MPEPREPLGLWRCVRCGALSMVPESEGPTIEANPCEVCPRSKGRRVRVVWRVASSMFLPDELHFFDKPEGEADGEAADSERS
jgi:hypothetical protein